MLITLMQPILLAFVRYKHTSALKDLSLPHLTDFEGWFGCIMCTSSHPKLGGEGPTHEDQPFSFHGALLDKMKQIADDLYKESRSRKGEDQMKLRFSYVGFTSEPSTLDAFQMPVNVLALLKESVEMYPDNVHFHILPVGA
ncbi:unnamed protein product [Orchesella dallaii]|uniref:Uncharacterized protein n=1 Tax=Orchesella dallaii TaxID=48710 RepID=A0ABP1PQ01_9HEXA